MVSTQEALKMAIDAIKWLRMRSPIIYEEIEAEKACKEALESQEARLVSYAPDGSTCTLNINGEEIYFNSQEQEFFDRGKQIAKWADSQEQEPVSDYVIIDGLKYPAMVEVMAIHDNKGVQTEDNCDCINAFLPQGTKLYTHPAPAWQGLTSKEVEEIEMRSYTLQVSIDDYEFSTIAFYEGIEQALKEKNT